jgi:CubicO group peptidase (beta-lactamase class C family)
MSFDSVHALVDAALADGACPGGQLLVADRGAVVLHRAFGLCQTVPSLGAEVTLRTHYDVASLTKAVATTLVVLRLVEAGRLALDTPVTAFIPELGHRDTRSLRVRDLLAHASGLPAWRPFHERLLAGERLGATTCREALLRMVATEPLDAQPGTRALYSDLGFMLLGFVAERAGAARLDALAERAVFEPLGLSRTRFVDLDAQPPQPRPSPVAATELCPRRGLVCGEVHDDNCHAAGGILGHAGLFSTAEELSVVVSALVTAWHGQRSSGGLPPELVRTFLSPDAAVPGSTRRLGWDGKSPGDGTSFFGAKSTHA